MTLQDSHKTGAVDIVIPVYCEKPEALAATLSACQKQTYPIFKIFVIDDGSPETHFYTGWRRISASDFPNFASIKTEGFRLRETQPLHARMPTFIACINTEILPNPDWLSTCANYLFEHPCVGACYTHASFP